MKPGALRKQRQKTHGDWLVTACAAQRLKSALDNALKGAGRELDPRQREAIEMILCKIARIISGDPNHPDHWLDIAGYSELGRTGK